MKPSITPEFYESAFKSSTGFKSGDPEPTVYEQAAGWFSAIDLAETEKVITKCAAKFIRKASAYFIGQSFNGRLTPEEASRRNEMADAVGGRVDADRIDDAMRSFLLGAGIPADTVEVIIEGSKSKATEVTAEDFGQTQDPTWSGPSEPWQPSGPVPQAAYTPASEDPSDREPANG